jgi:N-acetylmuramic acid 6-phosphate etherase
MSDWVEQRSVPPCDVTEQPNPRTEDLDQLPLEGVLERILEEDACVAEAVWRSLPQIRAAAEALLEVLGCGRRWFNLGAGTSGRIGVLDAAEIPPTFGLEPDRVQGLIAGGAAALERAIEGAEDHAEAAAEELDARGLAAGDALVGLSASGRTPYTLAGVRYARGVGARTVGVTCTPGSPLAEEVELPVVTVVGPEVLAGSTRLKGGLAQKMVLHTLSTTVMVRLGKVRGNRMSEIRGVTRKLQTRAVLTLCSVGGVPLDDAERRLEAAGGSLREALDRLERARTSGS